jgi:hypothetical protein
MTDPTEDIPPNRPLGEGNGGFELRAFGLGVTGAAGIGAVVELADQLDRTVQGVDAAVPMVTDIHDAPTDRAITVEDIEFPESEIRLLGPGVRHPANLRAVVRSIDGASKPGAYTRKTLSSSPVADR